MFIQHNFLGISQEKGKEENRVMKLSDESKKEGGNKCENKGKKTVA